jgi:hypothetical protein
MNHRFLTPALEELTSSAEYYESQCEGLGYRFLLEVDSTIRRIKNFPEAWGNASHEYRHCHLVGFPFTVIYDKDFSDGLLIVSVFHQHRMPKSWQENLSTR